jgi:small multidrug resistance family-3 protein
LGGRAAILLCRRFERRRKDPPVLNLFFLVLAITLEACGDASIRIGLRGHKPLSFVIGAVLVIGYGMIVGFPTWSFSRTMGVYIALFFIISQIVARVVLHERMERPTFVGGILIVSGGLVILFWPAR